MYFLAIENHKGEKLNLTQNPKYSVTNIEGLTPPQANINTAINANFDGSVFRSSRLTDRNIVITLAIEGDAEANRIELYRYIKAKKQCKLYYRNGRRDVSIVGYVESLNVGIFEQKEIAQVSILCPKPYFADIVNTILDMSAISSGFEFPFSIDSEGIEFSMVDTGQESIVQNLGDVETGAVIVFHATGIASNPVIYNLDTGEFFKVNIDMSAGDLLVISTIKGEKTVTAILGGIEWNYINSMVQGSSWIQFESGANTMLYNADSHPENLECMISFNNLYEGV